MTLGLLLGLLALAAPVDADRDGYPDAAELTSEDARAAFVRAFVAVALAQAPEPEPAFEPTQRDCAGLVRFAYREALKPHDAAFARRHPRLTARLPELPRWRYPDVPVLGDRLFRVRGGPFDRARLAADFDRAPTAERLVAGSCRPAQGPWRAADLLLFSTASGGAHLMIVTDDGPDPLLVYHTGPDGSRPGAVRRVRLSALRAHPDPAWRPVAANPSFRGAFRFKILEDR